MFLMELIFAILLFAIASAISVSAFAKAHSLSAQASLQNASVTLVSSAADLIRSSSSREDAEQLLTDNYNKAEQTDHVVSIYYDRNLAETNAANADYVLSVELSAPDQGLMTALLDFHKAADEDSVCHLKLEHAVTG